MKLKDLVGSGDKIGLFTLPFLITGLILNGINPGLLSLGPLANVLQIIAILMLVPGVIIWLWSVFLIITKVPEHKLITAGPYALMKHPLYTGVALLVLPAIGFLLNSWLGLLIGIVLYAGSQIYSGQEEKYLSQVFGSAWTKYSSGVLFPWL